MNVGFLQARIYTPKKKQLGAMHFKSALHPACDLYIRTPRSNAPENTWCYALQKRVAPALDLSTLQGSLSKGWREPIYG